MIYFLNWFLEASGITAWCYLTMLIFRIGRGELPRSRGRGDSIPVINIILPEGNFRVAPGDHHVDISEHRNASE